MAPFRKVLALINTRSGAREGRSVFASALQQYLDKAGVLHRDVIIPENSARHALLTHLPAADCLVVCGGDGTVSSVVNVLAAAAAEGRAGNAEAAATARVLLSKPIALVPTGLQNSVAHSLGVSSAERAVSQFVMGRADAVPVWEVRLNDRTIRYVCSYLSVGTYADTVRRFHELEAVGDEYMALPSLGSRKFSAAAFYSAVVKDDTVSCALELTTTTTGAAVVPGEGAATTPASTPSSPLYTEVEEGPYGQSPQRRCRYGGPLRMVLAAQMPLQHGGYSLAPQASYRQGRLAVTVATAEARRMRLWHLMRREAREGFILSEDGVEPHEGADGLTLRFAGELTDKDRPDSTTAGGGAKGATDCGKGDAAATAATAGTLMMLDGEPFLVPPGSVVTMRRVPDCTIPFLIC